MSGFKMDDNSHTTARMQEVEQCMERLPSLLGALGGINGAQTNADVTRATAAKIQRGQNEQATWDVRKGKNDHTPKGTSTLMAATSKPQPQSYGDDWEEF